MLKKITDSGSLWIYNIYYYANRNGDTCDSRLYRFTLAEILAIYKIVRSRFADATLFVWNAKEKKEYKIILDGNTDDVFIELPDEVKKYGDVVGAYGGKSFRLRGGIEPITLDKRTDNDNPRQEEFSPTQREKSSPNQ